MVIRMTSTVATVIQAVSPLLGTGAGAAAARRAAAAAAAAAAAGAAAAAAGAASDAAAAGGRRRGGRGRLRQGGRAADQQAQAQGQGGKKFSHVRLSS